MRLNVYDLTLKLVKNRANMVCFVGKKIWDIYESVAIKTAGPAVVVRPSIPAPALASEGTMMKEGDDDDGLVKLERDDEDEPNFAPERPSVAEGADMKPEIPLSSSSHSPMLKSENLYTPASLESSEETTTRSATRDSESNIKTASAPKTKPTIDWTQPRPLRLPHSKGYTYFWVTPNTSGLERTPVSAFVVHA
jgi:hypothetical protein